MSLEAVSPDLPVKAARRAVYAGPMPSACRSLLLSVLVLAPLALPVAGQSPAPANPAPEAHFPSSEDLRHLKSIATPFLSPDGRQVLFTVTESTADGAASHLWLAPVDAPAAKPRQITFSPPSDKRGEHAAQWAPDGSAIFFLAKRGEHTQLFRLDLRGGEAAPYDLKILPPVDVSKEKNAIPPAGTPSAGPAASYGKPAEKKPEAAPEPLPLDISGFALSEDDKWIALWARDPETPGEKKQQEAKADASWVDHEKHGTRLYLAALQADGALDGALRAAAVDPDVHTAFWSPASARLLVITEAPNEASDLGPANSAWLVDAAAPDKPVKLGGVPATVGHGAAWKPDGEELVFAAQTPEDAPPGYEELFGLSLAPQAAPRRLSAGFTGQVSSAALFFTADRSLVALAGVGTRIAAEKFSLDGRAKPAEVELGAPFIGGLHTNRRQSGWVWLAEGGGRPEALCYSAKLGDPCQAVPIPALAPAGLRAVTPELVHWQSGALTVEGLLYLPPPPASGKAPLIVDVHGGPFGAFENRNDAFADFLVGHGWAVLRPNPRGSSNYGVEFAAANKNDLGGGDYQDVMAGVDSVLARYPLDPARMALIGYSYGGEMAGFVEGKTDRFKAIVSGAPVIDQFSEYGNETDSWYDRWYFGKPWEHLEDAWRQSPLQGVARAKTPFLLLQGQADTTDPPGQSQEMYRALRQQGVPVDLVTYPREDHGPLAMGIYGRAVPEPWHGFDARQRMIEFIQRAFGAGEGTAVPAKP